MYLFLKPGLDRLLAAIGLLMLAPLFLWVAYKIKSADAGPVFFAQPRIGRGGRPFRCFKFRSMRMDAEAQLHAWKSANTKEWQEFKENHKLANDPRILPVGRFLRKTSLDELPQLVNILLGQMSLVGPRPVVADELYQYARFNGLAAYKSLTPGLTGMWQVSGRSDTTYRQRVTLDRFYRINRSFLLDARILAKTALVPFSQRGAY